MLFFIIVGCLFFAPMHSSNQLLQALELESLLPQKSLPQKPKSPNSTFQSDQFPTMSSFFEAVKDLPSHYKNAADYTKHSVFNKTDKKAAWTEFKNTMNTCFATIATSSIANKNLWVADNKGVTHPPAPFFDLKNIPPFIPYAQKIDADPETIFVIRGDLHGDIFSVSEELAYLKQQGLIDDQFNIINPKLYMVFLGDFVDRGQYGPEVVYLLMRLKIANPEQVILVRGNHDDTYHNKKCWHLGDFHKQVNNKFEHDANNELMPSMQIDRFYDLLPVVLYIGCNHSYIQCCHGGIEPGYLPQNLLDATAKNYQLIGLVCRKNIVPMLPEPEKNEYLKFTQTKPTRISFNWDCFDPSLLKCPTMQFGFLWNDFEYDDLGIGILYQHEQARPLMFGKNMTKAILKAQSSSTNVIHSIFRGHQHNATEMFNQLKAHSGILNMWNVATTTNIKKVSLGTVWTFNAAPDQPAAGIWNSYGFDAFAILTVKPTYSNWDMKVVNIQIIPQLPSAPLGSLPSLIKK